MGFAMWRGYESSGALEIRPDKEVLSEDRLGIALDREKYGVRSVGVNYKVIRQTWPGMDEKSFSCFVEFEACDKDFMGENSWFMEKGRFSCNYDVGVSKIERKVRRRITDALRVANFSNDELVVQCRADHKKRVRMRKRASRNNYHGHSNSWWCY